MPHSTHIQLTAKFPHLPLLLCACLEKNAKSFGSMRKTTVLVATGGYAAYGYHLTVCLAGAIMHGAFLP